MSNGKSIEQLLREGVRPEDLKMQLDDEIAKAKDKIEAEKAPVLKEIRHKLVENAIEYMKALDFDMDIDLSNEELEEVLESLEGELKKYEKILKILVEDKVEKEVPKASPEDEIIRKFLRGIM